MAGPYLISLGISLLICTCSNKWQQQRKLITSPVYTGNVRVNCIIQTCMSCECWFAQTYLGHWISMIIDNHRFLQEIFRFSHYLRSTTQLLVISIAIIIQFYLHWLDFRFQYGSVRDRLQLPSSLHLLIKCAQSKILVVTLFNTSSIHNTSTCLYHSVWNLHSQQSFQKSIPRHVYIVGIS